MRKKEENPLLIQHTYSAKEIKLATTRGLSTVDLLSASKSFLLDELLLPIDTEVSNRPKKITKNKQETYFEHMQSKILNGNWVSACISSVPSDLRAKQVAVKLFMRAIVEYQTRDNRKNINRSLPMWHRIYGGFGDNVRDMKSDYPSFLIISNITSNCSNLKLEKVRDILEKYNAMRIPVLVLTGGIDSYTLFATKLFYPIKYALHLGSNSLGSY